MNVKVWKVGKSGVRKMSNPQEALDWLKLSCGCDRDDESVKTLQELIEKSIPKKPYYVYLDEPLCPHCHAPLDGDEEYCDCCDQRIDKEAY